MLLLFALVSARPQTHGLGGGHEVDLMRVKDQNHGAVAHDSGPGNAFEIAKIRTQGLDDDFLAFQKLIEARRENSPLNGVITQRL